VVWCRCLFCLTSVWVGFKRNVFTMWSILMWWLAVFVIFSRSFWVYVFMNIIVSCLFLLSWNRLRASFFYTIIIFLDLVAAFVIYIELLFLGSIVYILILDIKMNNLLPFPCRDNTREICFIIIYIYLYIYVLMYFFFFLAIHLT